MTAPTDVEMVCCREVSADERHGPCVALAVSAARLREIPARRRSICDRHNRVIVQVAEARLGAIRP